MVGVTPACETRTAGTWLAHGNDPPSQVAVASPPPAPAQLSLTDELEGWHIA